MFTIFGAGGFIGSHFTRYLSQAGEPCRPLLRQDGIPVDVNLGHVIYSVGLTGDFRHRFAEALEAHVNLVARILSGCRFESFLYLSSTRVYMGNPSAVETAPLMADPADPDHFYSITKLMGESLCLANPNARVRVARLSNIVGADFEQGNFITSLIYQALSQGRIEMNSSLDSEKDYLGIQDAVKVLHDIACKGKCRIYNVASGNNVTHREVLAAIKQNIDFDVIVNPRAPRTVFKTINIERMKSEFDCRPKPPFKELPEIIKTYKQEHRK